MDLIAQVNAARERLIDFCARLVRTPSMTGEEGAVAQLVTQELTSLGIEEVHTDQAGNVIGRLRGGAGRSLMLHAHMDIVDPGERSLWQRDPFSGEIAEGCIWGRGAVDDKGSLAAQVYALGLLHQAGVDPPGDVWVVTAAGEEIGGLGTRFLTKHLLPDLAVIGEPSNNTLRRGHRGRFEFVVTWQGRSAHASMPQKGVSPYYSMGRFLLALRDAPMAYDADFGATTVAPTLVYVDQTSSNVIPARLSLHLDWRNIPSESLHEAKARLEGLLAATVEEGVVPTVRIATREVSSYTGMRQTIEHAVTPFVIAADDRRLLAAQEAVEQALGRPVPVEVWPFFTDGGFLHAAGVPCIGFGPGDPAMAHVADERLPIEQLVEATAGYMALALNLGREDAWR